MSTLVENVQKVVDAHAGLSAAIASKGVDVPEGTKLSEMPALVRQIETPPEMTEGKSFYEESKKKSIDVPTVVFVDFTKTTSLNRCFKSCTSLTSLTLPAGFGQNAVNIDLCFDYCTSLTSLTLPAGFGQNATSLNRCFRNCTSLTSLTLPAGFGQNAVSITNLFISCSALANITGNPNFKVSLNLSGCEQLTHDSLMVVINGLQTVTTSQVLTLGATNLAKLTDEEKEIATSKGWTIV